MTTEERCAFAAHAVIVKIGELSFWMSERSIWRTGSARLRECPSFSYFAHKRRTTLARSKVRAEAIGTRETGLPTPSLQGERGRATVQLRLFDEHVHAGNDLNQQSCRRSVMKTAQPRWRGFAAMRVNRQLLGMRPRSNYRGRPSAMGRARLPWGVDGPATVSVAGDELNARVRAEQASTVISSLLGSGSITCRLSRSQFIVP